MKAVHVHQALLALQHKLNPSSEAALVHAKLFGPQKKRETEEICSGIGVVGRLEDYDITIEQK